MQKYNVSPVSGNFNTLVAGTVTAAPAIFLGATYAKVAALSALVSVLAETNTLTISANWQVSNDSSTWVNVANGPQNAAAVALATGTAGADVAVAKMVPAPDAVYGWRYARLVFVNAVATGAAADTYACGYCYRQLTGAEGPV